MANIDYTSRDYAAIRDDLINNIPNYAPNWVSRDTNDFGIILLEMFAYMGDLQSFYIDRMANEAFLGTATQRDSVLAIAKLLGYAVSQGTPAYTVLTFQNTTTSPITVPALTQVSTSGIVSSTTPAIVFETSASITVPASGTQTVIAYQGVTVTETLTTQFNGSPSQVFKLLDSPVDVYSITISVNNVAYTQVDNLIDYSGTLPVFSTYTDALNNTYIQFGDNVGGRIPPINSTITATYRVIDGTLGNVASNTLTYIQTNYSPGLTCYNNSAAVGGADVESTDSIRINAPQALKALNRAVTLDDYSSLVLQTYGVGKANAVASDRNNIVVYMGSVGGGDVVSGTPTAVWTTLKSSILNSISTKMPPGVTLTISPPTYLTVNITMTVSVYSQYSQSAVQANVTSAVNTLLDYSMVSFGELISAKDIILAAGLVEGVSNVTLTGYTDVQAAANEIPVLGTLTLTMSGGVI